MSAQQLGFSMFYCSCVTDNPNGKVQLLKKTFADHNNKVALWFLSLILKIMSPFAVCDKYKLVRKAGRHIKHIQSRYAVIRLMIEKRTQNRMPIVKVR